MGCLKLTLNETKTSIRDARAEHFDFLAYSFGPEHHWKGGRRYLTAKPSQASVKRLRKRVRAVLAPGNHDPWPEVAARLNRILVGWANYFSHGSRWQAYGAIDHYVSLRVCGFLQRRHNVPTRGTRRFTYGAVFGQLGVLRLGALLARSLP